MLSVCIHIWLWTWSSYYKLWHLSRFWSMNNYDSGLTAINCMTSPRGSPLGILLFLLYINYFNQAIQFFKVHHFADKTNISCLSNSINKLNKLVNADLKHLVNWLNANKYFTQSQFWLQIYKKEILKWFEDKILW